MAVNARAPMLLVAALAPALMARGTGAIVNISTGEVATPARDSSAYSASKAALAHLTLAWAAELGPAGIRVNAVQPGPVRTPALAALPAPVTDALARLSALGRIAEPYEIAEMVAFLASPRASYANGTIVEIHGGTPVIG